MEPFIDKSCALDNCTSTLNDMSKLSDTLPSISIDETQEYQEICLKDYYDKIDRLRKENFDLKLKVYLLESNEQLTSDSDLKFKVLKQFKRKNEEIQNLKENIKHQNKEITDLKKRLKTFQSETNKENESLRSKLTETVEICSNLIFYTESLINMNRQLPNETIDVDLLNSSQAFLEKASQILKSSDLGTLNNINIKAKNVDKNGIADNFNEQVDDISADKNSVIDFMEVVQQLLTLIEDFRSNKVTYKLFSTNLDSLFETLHTRHNCLNECLKKSRDRDNRLMITERKLAYWTAYREKINSKLRKSTIQLDGIISNVANGGQPLK